MAINPNWPVIEEGWGPAWNANGGGVPASDYVSLVPRSIGQTSVRRGRQYELDQVRAGEYQTVLSNTDGALDPNNSSGPWYKHIAPYQPYRKRAQWPPTANLLTQVQATGGEGSSAGTLPASAAILSATDSTGGSVVASASAWQGSNVLQFAVPASTAASNGVCYTGQPAIEPGTTYSLQMQVRNVTPSTTISVQTIAAHFNAAGSVISGTGGTSTALVGGSAPAWTRITLSFTVPANTAYSLIGVQTSATSPGSTLSVQVDGWQLEKAASPSAWTAPGIWYPMYGGFVERWPSTWDLSGTFGLVQPTAVDAMALLSQTILSDPLTEEITSHKPRFLYTLADPQGSTAFTDSTGNFPSAAQTGNSKYGVGALSAGNQITAASSTGKYTGSSGTVVTFANTFPGQSVIGPATFINLSTAGIRGPANTALWTRVVAFRYTGAVPAALATIWGAMDGQRASNSPSGSRIQFQIVSTGALQLYAYGPTGANAAFAFPGGSVCDSNWHLAIVAWDQANGVTCSLDGSNIFYGAPSASVQATGLVGDALGCFVDYTDGLGTTDNYAGDMSFVAEFPTSLSPSDITNLYTAWKSSCTGESSNARYARILKYAGYTGSTNLQAGLTTSMGPAALAGQDALSALQAIVDTENGEHFVDRTGTVTFRSRAARYNSLTPVYTFGENTAAGEWPYEDCQLDYDPTHLANQVTVTQASGNQNFVAQDATSITAYFPRTLTRTVNASSTLECQDAAGYLLSRYKNPAVRISAIKLHPSANTALWPICLSLELGTRVRIMRRPPGAPAIQVDCFIESIQVDMDNQGDAWWTLQCSPVDLTPYAAFASWHTTLTSTIASGVSTITVNASADNTNPLATQVGAGQQLVLGQNSTNQETVTVQSVGATTAGWTTAAITLTANTTKSHTAGDVICEPLPTGITDPTTWDAVTKFDSAAFAY